MGMAADSTNETRWEHVWKHHNSGMVWDTAVIIKEVTGVQVTGKRRKRKSKSEGKSECKKTEAKPLTARRLGD